jgi:hypothetical protein
MTAKVYKSIDSINSNGLIFSLFKDSIANPNAENEQISISDLKQLVLNEPSKEQSDALRLCRENNSLLYKTGDKQYKDLSNKYKKKLNYVTLSGVINGIRNTKNLVYNGCVQIDIDCKYKGGDFAASEIKNLIIQKVKDKTFPYVIMCATSPRAYGVKCLVATNNNVLDYHTTVLSSVAFEISEIINKLDLGFEILDDKGKDARFIFDNISAAHPCFIPYDSNAFFNESFEPFVYTHVAIAKAFEIKSKKYVIDSKSISYTNNSIELSVNTKLDMLESIIKKRNRYNDSRNCFVFQLASMAKEYSINCFECLSYCLNYCESDFADVEIKRVVNSAYKGTPKVQYLDYQLVAYAKKINTYVPNDVLTSKPRFVVPQKDVLEISSKNIISEKHDYLSNIMQQNNISYKSILNKLVIAGTGIGKTNFFSRIPLKKIVVCPTKGLVKMCCEKYGATVWTGDDHNIHAVLKSDYIATTYASFLTLCFEMQQNQHFLLDTAKSQLFSMKKELNIKQTDCGLHSSSKSNEFLNELSNQIIVKQLEINDLQHTDILKRYHIILDESHNIVANANKGYQLKDLEAIIDRVKDCASFTCFTGTYLRSNAVKMPIFNIVVPQRRIPLNVVTCEVVRDVLLEKIIQSIQNKRFPIVFLNNTSNELERLKASLSQYKITYFNAHNKQDDDYKELVNTSNLHNSLQGIVTTSVLKEGIDINNDFDFDFYFVGRHHSSTIKQVIARSRSKINDVKAFLLRSLDAENDKSKIFDYDLEKYNLEKRTNTICEILNLTKLENHYTEISNLECDLVQRFENMPLHFSERTQRYEIRPLLFDNHLYEIETTFENQNLNLLKENLSKLSIDLISDSETTEIAEKQDTFLQDTAVEIKKDKEKNEFNAVIETINRNPLDARNKILKMYKSNALSKIEKKTYKMLKTCLDYGYKFSVIDSSDDVITLDATKDIKTLIELPTEKNFKAFAGILKAYVLRNNELYMNHNSIVAIQIKAFISKFEGKTLSKDEIKALTIEAMQLNKGIDIKKYTDAAEKDNMRKFFDILSLFFKIDRTQRRRGENVYRFSSIQLSIPKKDSTQIKTECELIENTLVINDGWDEILLTGYDVTMNERMYGTAPF